MTNTTNTTNKKTDVLSNKSDRTSSEQTGLDPTESREISEQDWKSKLTPEQYKILREKKTEMPFSGKHLREKRKGIYKCAGCGCELFSSDTKFESGTGWPSFTNPINRENVILREDGSLFMSRIEVLCKKCGGHLGHVFNDGPRGKNR